ncbi:MAG: hypothetical protein M3Q07_22450 [Pseudobdellovibrionaceae bacterium]|nr:hypothetical protein [Pseudobdellovibrionaceae bacterium]
MIEHWLYRFLEFFHEYTAKKKKTIDRLSLVMNTAFIAALGLILMTPPAWDFFEGQRRSKEITPAQQLDYEGLVSVADDAAVVKAAEELLKRDDVVWVRIQRGPFDSPILQLSHKKPEVNFESAPRREIGGYSVRVAYRSPPTSGWAEFRTAHAVLAFVAGLFIVLFALLSLWESLLKLGRTGDAKERVEPLQVPPEEPRLPDPTPPAPPPMVDDAPEAGKSGLRLVK